MESNRPHPILEQVPLTVSPFVNLPTATTLSYNYKAMPSALPPSVLGNAIGSTSPDGNGGSNSDPQTAHQGDGAANKPRYIVSASGQAAHPSDIISSCQALQAHLDKMQHEAERTMQEHWERMRQRDLAEKRRVAPGWLDSESKLLQPVRAGGGGGNLMDEDVQEVPEQMAGVEVVDPGAELDRVFGGMNLK